MSARPVGRISVRDVAARAGVSQPTVSLVLSRHPRARIAAETRARVLRVAEELGYRPNMVARGLVRRRSYALGVIVPALANPFFTDVVSGAERVAAEEGYAVLLCEARDGGPEGQLRELLARQIDGVLLDAHGAAALGPERLAGLNVVLIDEPSEQVPGVASDAEGAGRLAAEHLLGLGHRELAFIGPAAPIHALHMRERGFVRALRAAGLGLPSHRLVRAPATVAGGREAMRRLLAGGAPPTGVFCANDLVAIGALKTCVRLGLAVPGRLSIVGCDDLELASLVTPELTTVAVPARELGARAARLLIRRLAGRAMRPPARPLPVRLLVRGTTGPAPQP